MAAVDVVDDSLRSLPGPTRRLAHAEWGLTVPAGRARHGRPPARSECGER
jgi:hypothetical protein